MTTESYITIISLIVTAAIILIGTRFDHWRNRAHRAEAALSRVEAVIEDSDTPSEEMSFWDALKLAGYDFSISALLPVYSDSKLMSQKRAIMRAFHDYSSAGVDTAPASFVAACREHGKAVALHKNDQKVIARSNADRIIAEAFPATVKMAA